MCAFAAATSPSARGQQGWLCSNISNQIPLTSVCTWAGLVCDGGGAVTTVYLSGLYLTGSIPHEIGLISSLTHIELNDNALTGSFPTLLGALSNMIYMEELAIKDFANLEYLDISQNSFSGIIPSFVGAFSSLQYLSLSGNSFIGYLPSSLCQLHNLTSLYFDNNNFVCYFDCLSSISDLRYGSVPPICTNGKREMLILNIS